MVLRKEITLQIKDLLKENPQGLSITDIVKVVNINRNTAGRYLEKLLISGQVEMRHLGMAKIYKLTQRVPLSAVLSISSELVMQLDSSLRIIFANEPFLELTGTDSKNLLGKNIEYTPVAQVFDEAFTGFIENIRMGTAGKEWSGEIALSTKDMILFCRIAPTVFEDGRKGVSVFLDDITEQKRTEEALEWSEEKYRSLIETTGTGYVILDKDGRVITANQEYVGLTGRSTLAEIEGRPVTDWTAPYDIEGNAREIEQCFRNGQVRNLEIDYQKPDGTIQPIEINASVVRTVSGPIILTLCRDITQRKQVEKELRESEERYRQLVEISPDAVIIHQEGKIFYINPAAVKLLGASQPDEIIGKNVLDFIHPDFHDSVMKNIEKDLKEEISPSLVLQMIRLDGTSIIVEGRGVRTSLGGKPAIQVAIRDISESKRAEAALRESEEKYRSFIERANDGIVVVQDGILKMSNRAITEFWGGSIEQILGKNFTDFIHPDALPEIVNRYNQRIAGESPPSIYETILMRKDGSRFFAELNAGIISYEGKIADLVIVRDINERKKAEKALRESEEKLNAMLKSIPDPMSMMDKDLTIMWANEPAKQYFGKDIVGKKCYKVYHMRPDPCEPSPCLTLKAFLDGKTHQHETTVIDSQGEERFFECTATVALRDNSGIPVAVLETSRDITEKKKAEDQLRESEATARALLNAPTDSVILIDCEGKILALNEIAASRFGKRSDELVGIMTYDILPKEVAQLRRSLMVPVLDKREMVRFVDQGDGIWYDTVAYPIVNESGDVEKIAIIARDVTEQKNTEKQLRESQQKFLRFLEQSFDVIAIRKEGKIVFLNDRAAKILGAATPLDLIGRSIFDFIHPDSLRDMEDHLQKLSADPGLLVPVLTEKFLRVDGTIATTEIMAIRFYENLFIRFG